MTYVESSIGNYFWYFLVKNKNINIYSVVDRGKFASYIEHITFNSDTIYDGIDEDSYGISVVDVNGKVHSLVEMNINPWYDSSNKSLAFFDLDLATEYFKELIKS